MVFFVVESTGRANLEALGVVVQASHASLGSPAASEGTTTIYDGVRLSTDAEGALQVRIGEAVMHFGEGSSVVLLHHSAAIGGTREKQFDAELLAGAAVLSVTAANLEEIVACSARVRPVAQERGVVRVQILGPHEPGVYAQCGPAQISYRDETETIPEGKAYRVMLNTSDNGAPGEQGAKASGKRGKAFLLIAIGAATAAGAALPWKDIAGGGAGKRVESPLGRRRNRSCRRNRS